jgi:hypothetical protein
MYQNEDTVHGMDVAAMQPGMGKTGSFWPDPVVE